MRLFPKLTLMVSGLLLATILCLSTLYYWSEQRQIRQDALAEQQAILQSLVQIAQHAFVAQDDLLLAKYTHLLQQWNPQMLSASVVDSDGHIRAHSEPRRIGQTSDPATPAPAYAMTVSQAVRFGSHTFGTASITFSQQLIDAALQARLARLRRRLGTVTVLALLLGCAGSFVMALSWTRPIQRVVRQTETIGQGHWELERGSLEERPDELGVLSKAIHAMAGQLAQLDEMKEDFVTAVTHELRSPLGAIESFLNLMDHEKVQKQLPDSWDLYHHRIRKNVQRLTRFINDLLDVSALDRGKVQLNPQTFDLAPVIRQTLELFETTFAEKHLAAEMDIPDGCPKVLADPEKITQVLVNLVSNAIKFTPNQGEIRVCVEPLPGRKAIQISVSDSGIGIREVDQARIFNKFEQVKSARQGVQGPKGTGLGLSISRAVIELHGSELQMRSRWGEGSTFFFTLPMANARLEPVALHN